MVAESNAKAKKNSADDEHCNVLCSCIHDCTCEETDRPTDDASPPAFVSGHVRRPECGDQGCQVKRGCEECEDLIIVFTVVCFLEMQLFSSVYFWEEFLEEVIHGSHPSCNSQQRFQTSSYNTCYMNVNILLFFLAENVLFVSITPLLLPFCPTQ